jgi:N-acetyl-gamma-glutamyl-phosphate reductase
MTTSVALIGARGYVGAELLALLADHPGFELAFAASRSLEGETVPGFDLQFENLAPADAAHRRADVWVLALPNGLAPEWVEAIGQDATILDISADHRFTDTWVYGLPERNRHRIRGARRVANPGCYATGAQLGLGPLRDANLLAGPPHVFGVSGYSGAGSTPNPRNDPDHLRDNLLPYALTNHTHEREISRHLEHEVFFSPHVAPFFRGITLTISAPLHRPCDEEALASLYGNAYGDEPFVTLSDKAPEVRDACGTDGVYIGAFSADREGRRAAFVVTLDNLRKGAATQALQNLNLTCGYPEGSGLMEGSP